MTHVFLVRHGQASAGTNDYDRLSETGVEQSRLLGEHWKQCGFRIDAAYNGTLQRQQHTAELVLAGVEQAPPVHTLNGLDEYDHSTIDLLHGQGSTSDGGDLTFEEYLEIMIRWRDAPDHSDAQSWQRFAKQGWQAIQAAVQSHTEKQRPANLVFFTSGGIIATVLQHVLSLDFEPTMHALWQTRNASVTNILFDNNGVCMVDYNVVAHLQGRANDELITMI